MRQIHQFIQNGDRYAFDFNLCSVRTGFAQVDTSQDAWYYGNWANPTRRVLVSYCEGDLTITTADTDKEFAEQLRRIKRWNDEHGHQFFGIDPGFDPNLRQAFVDVGAGDLLH